MYKFRSFVLVLGAVLAVSLYTMPLYLNAQIGHGSRGSGGTVSTIAESIVSSATLPATCTAGDVYFDTDATSGVRFSICDDTDSWIQPISSVSSTLDNIFDNGKIIDGANSLANAVRIGDGTTPICLYTDATLGPQVRPCTDADVRQVIPTNFTGGFYDEENTCWILRIDPDAASSLAAWTFTCTATLPKKSVWFDAGAASVDGTQCATPTESSNTLVKTWTIVCADNDAGAMYWKVAMPDAWDGGTVTVELQIHQVGASTNAIQIDFAAMCYSHDEAISAFASPPTGEQPADITLTADNDVLHGTTAAITVAGTTCAGGDTLFLTGQVDATASHADIATAVEILGAKLEYGISSLSD